MAGLWCGKFGVTLRIGGAFIRVRIILAVPRHRLELLICPLGFDRRAAPLVAHVTDAELEERLILQGPRTRLNSK